MTCAELSEFLMEYLDGLLAPDSRGAFERHLAACPECCEYLRSYQAAIALGRMALVNQEEVGTAPVELIDAILASRSVARRGS